MSSKDESIFSKEALMHTDAGKDILKQSMLRSERYKQFQYYKELADREFPIFLDRFVRELHSSIINDDDPLSTLRNFVREVEIMSQLGHLNTLGGLRTTLLIIFLLLLRPPI